MNPPAPTARLRAPAHAVAVAAALLLAPSAGHAESAAAGGEAAVETVEVWGKRQDSLGQAMSASQGVVDFAAFAERPLLRPGELVEVIPGMAATQHSGSGKANQYFLRGFNLDHGTDFSASFDGAPLNLRTNAHGQGYLDLNFLIPELVQTVRYQKGPYDPRAGDFSAAGSAQFETPERLDENLISATAGAHAYGRLLATHALGEGYAAAAFETYRGPWTTPEDLGKAELILRQQVGDWALTAVGYDARWNAANQIPERAVDSGALSLFGVVDPTDAGRTSRVILAARREAADGLDVSGYVQAYRLRLWNDFTYFLDDPTHGDQFEQEERRWITGGALSRRWQVAEPLTLTAGAEARLDDIGKIGLYHTERRARLSTVREDSILEWSGALWAAADWSAGPLRANLGVRTDVVGADVRSDTPPNSGHVASALVSPKLALAWRAADHVELYFDAGRSYHTNDARGAVAHVAPATGEPTAPAPLIVPATGIEVGARWEQPGLKLAATLWALDLASELVFSGDAGDTESTAASRRLGVEWLADWSPVPALNLDLAAGFTHARYRDAPGQNHIPNALDYVLSGGATARVSETLSGEITFRRLGPAALIEDNSIRSKPATVVNLEVRQRFARCDLRLEILNLFDSRDDDIAYAYVSRLPGEPAAGVMDTHVHPLEPRALRVGLEARF